MPLSVEAAFGDVTGLVAQFPFVSGLCSVLHILYVDLRGAPGCSGLLMFVLLQWFMSKRFLFQSKEVPPPQSLENAHALLFLGDKVTTDHISPAGSIARVSAAAKYLMSKRSVSTFKPF